MAAFLPLMQSINDFFEDYAKALELYDAKGMANLYHMPCTMLSDDTTSIFNEPSKLEGFFNQGAGFYRQFGIANVLADVWSSRPFTERIVSVKVCWRYMDVFKKPIYDCDYFYTMKLDKNDVWKIVQSVSVNEKQRMEEWKEKSDKARG